MSESEGTVAAHEAYAFACMRCGHGWEQSFDIEHHVDGKGEPFVVYKSGGKTVPSPLTSPSCPTCEAHVVRIMRSGRVARYRELTRSYGMDAVAKQPAGRQPVREAVRAARTERAESTGVLPAYDAGAEVPETVAEPWHPHLPEFLRHLFHHEHAGHPGGR
ncbi:hypothetical protein [Streptomyces montanisoli]|uniref:C2H2-type domain-containing protein n=1 Tax=Streptomyces montanisoli TaxID=2798581 RepID=A0A940MLJ5_9ACTN|nr:hypothetical protein [Streptomyces montanisoli]MBP0462072.1 hypothetical protein [Streptomyces montanisoli]